MLFALYAAGVAGALLVAWVHQARAAPQARIRCRWSCPNTTWPNLRNLLHRPVGARADLPERVGTIILALMVLMWFLASFPAPPAGDAGLRSSTALPAARATACTRVRADRLQLADHVALVPGLAAREVVVGALGTVYSLSAAARRRRRCDADDRARWTWPRRCRCSPGTCSRRMPVDPGHLRRETNTWRYPVVMAGYLFVLAYLAGGVTHHLSRWLLAAS